MPTAQATARSTGSASRSLLELYRSLVLLRTYDERSVVYDCQGRIGTYAIFWNHEAMQAGAVHALDDEDWVFPLYRETAIGLLRGMPPATVLSRGARRSLGLVEPEGGPRRVDLRADRDTGYCMLPGSRGEEAEGRERLRERFLRRRCDVGGRVPRGANVEAVMLRAAGSCL